MANTVDKVLNIAEAEVGYLEKKTNADLDSKTKNAGYNNYTKYGRDMHKLYPSVMDFPAAVIAHTVAAIRYGFAAFDAFFPLNRSDSYRTAGADVLLFSDSLIADRATPWEKRSD